MNFLMLSIRRPVAVGMFFLGIVLMGGVAWQRMPVELFPALSGDRLTVNFNRPGSEPEVIEREILLPLQAKTSTLPHVSETWGEIRGTSGRFQVRFESGADIKIRELELQRLASALQRAQPRGTSITVTSSDTSVMSSFVMMIQVVGGDDGDLNTLHDLAQERIAPRFAAVAGISQVLVNGGAPRQVTVTIDPDRAAALGVTTEAVSQAVQRNVGHLRFVGALEDESGRTSVILDGRPDGLASLGEARVQFGQPVRLRHVSEVTYGNARETSRFRVNGKPAIGLVLFQQQGANLVRLGSDLRNRLEDVREELKPLGLDLVIGFDAAKMVEDQISRLAKLGASGFVIALLVLFLFLRQWRAVAVVGIAVPISLLASLSLLFMVGQSFNLITLFGMFVAIGLVVDNSVVVYEAVQRQLEQGADIEKAVREGLRRTVRAIIAASATTAVVFLPMTMVEFDNEQITALVRVVTLSVLLPLGASLVVAVGLVPLLAHRLAAPAALRKLAEVRQRRLLRGDLVPPDRARLLFGGIVARALRHPPAWISGTVFAVLITAMIALPWVMVNTSSQEPPDGDIVQLSVRFPSGQRGVDATSTALGRLERAVLDLEGVRMVEALAREDGGSLTVHLKDDRPAGFRSQDVRNAVRQAGKEVDGLEILRPGEDEMDGGKGDNRGGGGPFEAGPAEIVLSGPESAQLQTLAKSVRAQLQSMPEVAKAWMSSRPGLNEIWVEPNQRAFEAFGLTFDQVLPFLSIAGREGQRMQTGFVLPSGRELPLVIERRGAREARSGSRDLRRLRIKTDAGVVPVSALVSMRRMPAPPTIVHHNGRRESKVFYRLSDGVPSTGPGRLAVEEQILGAVRSVPRPRGYTVETVNADETTSQLQQVLLPAILLLFLVLAMTFESLTLPVLVLISLPLTLLGATWALAFAGMPLGPMAMLGAMALIGLTVNPGILLVDRMQQLVLGAGWSSGSAALAAVRERTRPVMMTTATTIAGLWPLAIVTGRENEIWPPFATIVIGGLITSSLLTLLMIPVGFILLRNLDRIFGRVGPWLVLVWLGSTAALMTALILTDTVTSTLWQVALTFLIGGGLLSVVVLVFRPRDLPEPDCSQGPPKLEVRYLHKIYGLPGPIRATLIAPKAYAKRVLARGGQAFHTGDARDRLGPLLIAGIAMGYLAYQLQTSFWTLVFWMIAAGIIARLVIEIRRARGRADATGTVLAGGIENRIAALIPWIAIGIFTWISLGSGGGYFLPIASGVILAIVQGARRSAHRQAAGSLEPRANRGSLRPLRSLWRRACARFAGLDLPTNPVTALAAVSFTVERGMVGILGPNGAGKTTLLRQLAGVLSPTRGTIHLGGIPFPKIQRYLAHWVGYLPQDAGLPAGLTPKEYLTYWAALYDLPKKVRGERVASLLSEVGLTSKVDEPIKTLSGGMRQRVAVARTLLRLPPLIIVDEPTVGLDPRERIRFRNLLGRLAQDRIVMFSTHVVEDVAVACERVLVLAEGRLLFDGAPDELSRVAKGCVWEMRTSADAELHLPPGAIHAEESPTADGSIVHRIVTAEKPDDSARELNATLEDGYMWLVASSRAKTEATRETVVNTWQEVTV